MRTLVDLIQRHARSDEDFQYYIPIIEEAEENEISHPDITVDCCYSLLQGISKTIVKRLDPACDWAAFDNASVNKQVRAALMCLKESDGLIEIAFPTAAEQLANITGQLRKERGDISHGRVVPKELMSDKSLSRLMLNVCEALLRYMLASFFSLRPHPPSPLQYDDNPDFNEFLDGLYPLEGKPLYSRALFDQYFEDYDIQLRAYRDGQGEGVAT
jgi:hypothetical protein